MDFGRVKDPSKIDFTLPPDLPVNAGTLENVSPRGKTKVYIGSPVGGQKDPYHFLARK